MVDDTIAFYTCISIDCLYSLRVLVFEQPCDVYLSLVQFDDLGKPTKEKMEVKKSKRRLNCLKLVELIGFVGC